MDKKSLVRHLIVSHLALLALLSAMFVARVSLFVLLPVMCIAISLVIWRISHMLHKQFELISAVAIQIAEGDHSMRIPSLELDEIDHVGKDLNTMLGKLDKTIHHLAVHREELRLVLGTIEDVLWSQNLDGKLEWANQAFQKLFPAYSPKQRQHYWDVIREPILLNVMTEMKQDSSKFMHEIQLGENYYLLSGTRNESAKRNVFILQNIDEIRAAEQMKKDFVVNLAHELRTPLTAIKGFTDAMQENPNGESARYLKIIQNHTNRLIHLIADLEQLIRLERTAELAMQEINLSTFFDNISLVLTPHVEEKGLKLVIDLDKRLPRIYCDPFKLEQVFINLVQNSLRYTSKGEIRISSQAQDHKVVFTVSDTGSGIDPKHLPRIFERFYVADASRNRNISGTGLGLAIVKHIVLLHQGSIEVSSEKGKGTSFSISLPTDQQSGNW